ncbi:hypothetical protein D3C87_1624960 [compost metagenome]
MWVDKVKLPARSISGAVPHSPSTYSCNRKTEAREITKSNGNEQACKAMSRARECERAMPGHSCNRGRWRASLNAAAQSISMSP